MNYLRVILVAAVFSFSMAENSVAKKNIPGSRTQIQFSYAPLVKKIAPSVVNVYAARQIKQKRSPFSSDPFFEQFFGRRSFGRPRQRTARSLGSGVIIDESGIVITNHHVIKDADEVKVSLSDGREFRAEILLIDKKSDLAILRLEATQKFPAVVIGDSEDLEVGDLVLAIGNPFGVGQTVTSGIVSALARSQGGIDDFGFFIQTDASINPGNSGGALVDMAGRLIGINTSIFPRSGGSNGIGFAVPSNMVRVVLDSVKGGSSSVLRPWIGADFQTVTSDISQSLGLDRPRGALVAGLYEGGPAQRAGIRLGDVILEIDGKPIEHMNALGYRLATTGVGREVQLKVLSRDKQQHLTIKLEQAPETPARDARLIEGRSPFAGIRIANLSPRVAMELNLPTARTGVVIISIEPNSSAARFGLRPNDIILDLNSQGARSTRHIAQTANKPSRLWRFTINRNGRQISRVVC